MYKAAASYIWLYTRCPAHSPWAAHLGQAVVAIAVRSQLHEIGRAVRKHHRDWHRFQTFAIPPFFLSLRYVFTGAVQPYHVGRVQVLDGDWAVGKHGARLRARENFATVDASDSSQFQG